MKKPKQQSGSKGCGSQHILTLEEKQNLTQRVFVDTDFRQVDFSDANLQRARFQRVRLRGCDFTGANLKGVEFLDCDLTSSCLTNTTLADNRFEGTCFDRVTGLSGSQRRYVEGHGGSFTPRAKSVSEHAGNERSSASSVETMQKLLRERE